jgi:hypothetical protein
MVEAAALAAVSAGLVAALAAFFRASRRASALESASRRSAEADAAPVAGSPVPAPALLLEPAVLPDLDRLGDLLVGLERLRVEREWSEVAGPGVPPPVAWDGTLAGFVAVELAVIREVIGTPGQLSGTHPSPGPATDPPGAGTAGAHPAGAHPAGAHPAGVLFAATARLASELLRVLAHAGEEMDVTVGPSALTVEQPGSSAAPDLDRLAALARSAGGDLSCEADGRGTTTRLVYPGGRRAEARPDPEGARREEDHHPDMSTEAE